MRCVDSSGVCANEWWCGGLDRDVELVARLNNNMLECVPTGQCEFTSAPRVLVRSRAGRM